MAPAYVQLAKKWGSLHLQVGCRGLVEAQHSSLELNGPTLLFNLTLKKVTMVLGGKSFGQSKLGNADNPSALLVGKWAREMGLR